MYTLFRETYHSVTSRFFSNNTCWNERLITPSGLVFVGQILGKSSFVKKINRAPISKDYLQKQIKNGDVLREMHIEPTALDNGFVPVDTDVTPFDNSKSNKEGVSRTYKGFDGYAPIMAYIGTEGYLVNLELRIGKQHCQKETPDFLKEPLTDMGSILSYPI